MKRTIIACSMLEDELQKVFKESGCTIPAIWIERGYHNVPGQLKGKLQETINSLQDNDEILLAFGLCGNGADGIVSPHAVLVLPKFDDCIHMLLCKGKRKTRRLTETGSIYLTRGWTLDEEAILAQHKANIEKYGEETAQAVLEIMYRHYEKIVIIETDSYEIGPVKEYAQKTAELLDLSTECIKGSTKILKQLITRQWDENFIVQKPGQPISSLQWELSAGN